MTGNIPKLISFLLVFTLVVVAAISQRSDIRETGEVSEEARSASVKNSTTGNQELPEMVNLKAKTIEQREDKVENHSIRLWEESLSKVPASVSRKVILPLFSAERGDRIDSAFPFYSPAVVNMAHHHENGVQTVGMEMVDQPGAIIYLKKEVDGSISGRVSRDHATKAIEISSVEKDDDLAISIRDVEEMICSRKVNGVLLSGLIKPESSLEAGESNDPAEASDSGSIPALESRPGAKNTIFLNFAGETVSGTTWNSRYNNGDPIVAAAYRNSDAVEEIWAVIAEDYRAFDVNVTTDRSVFDNTPYRNRCMAIFTPTKSWFGSGGGVAYLNSFGDSTDYMCWVFNSSTKSAAEAGSHEVGHQLGLLHDGSADSTYYSGHKHDGTGIKWAPIMGSSYSSTISQFSKGEYAGANVSEDDLAIIGSELGNIEDDFSNSPEGAMPPEGSNEGIVNLSGMIGVGGDKDVFQFPVSQRGPISITAFPNADDTNLDLKMEILNESGEIISSSAPEASFSASIETGTLEIGNYYLVVSGDSLGTPTDGYSSYGSIGEYQLSGECPPTNSASAPENFSATDGTITPYVELNWTGDRHATEYRVYRKSSGLLASYSQIGTTTANQFRDETGNLDQVYTYYVTAANPLGESDASNTDVGFRQERPSTPENLNASNGSSTYYTRIQWESSERATKYRVFRSLHADGSGEIQIAELGETSFDDSSGKVETPYYYFVRAVNAAGTSDRSAIASGSRAAAYDTPGSVTTTSLEGGILVSFDSVSGSNSYTIFRGTGSDAFDAVEMGTVEGNEFYDRRASSAKNYTYFVRANGSAGNSTLSSGAVGSRSGATPGDDRFEANDRIEEAYSLQNFEGTWLGSYAGVAKALDEDWYSIVPQENADRADIILSPRSADSPIGFSVRGKSGEIIDEAVIGTKGSILSVSGLIPGETYYIVVNAAEGRDAGYNLMWTSVTTGNSVGHADLTIGRTPGSKIGEYIYESRAKRQNVSRRVRGSRKTRNYAAIANKSVEDATLVATGSRRNRKASFTYFAKVDGEIMNVTSAMARGGVHIEMAPLESLKMEISMRPKRKTVKRGKKVVGNFGAQLSGRSGFDVGRFTYHARKKRR